MTCAISNIFSPCSWAVTLHFSLWRKILITEPLFSVLLACKVDSWYQSVIDYQRGRKDCNTEVFDLLRTSSHLTTASIKVWPRSEKILSPADWLVVIKHSKEFAFVVVKSGRQVGCFENKRSILVGTWMQCNWRAAVTKVLTRLRLRASHCSFHQGSRCCWSQIKELIKTLENIMHPPYVQPRLVSIKVESETIGPRVVRNVDSSSEGWLIWSLF